ncbi:hypothetical protein FAES_3280 [Fibrella aestuarina BUZ 2]|uniref:ParB-related ThiF-related cassette protein E domain-containing protein n=1 Tax=Fibrella aestuarina BUZ 2 TaxID=1166018 RepID=I0KAY6_9BACT|nr:PRTRC system protein E [Fibrella aestuarina]CCH01289.1 hypothetical protein FAES_3280 [Fibrella aestuarina BUZ 2]
MTFFQQLAALNLVGTLNFSVTKVGDKMTVSVRLDNPSCGDAARNQIRPLTSTGTPVELDAGWFDAITKPMQSASGLMVDMETHQKSLDKARQDSAMNKSNGTKSTTPTPASSAASTPAKPTTTVISAVDKKTQVYMDAMQKVDKLREEGRYMDALSELPKSKDYPNNKILEKRRTWLANMAMGGVLIPDPWPIDPATEKPAAATATPETPAPAPAPTVEAGPVATDNPADAPDESADDDKEPEENLDSPLVEETI